MSGRYVAPNKYRYVPPFMVWSTRHDVPRQRSLRRKWAGYIGVGLLVIILLLEVYGAFRLRL